MPPSPASTSIDRSPVKAEIRATLAIALPLAGGNLAQIATQVTNIVMVGHLGAAALAAAGLGAVLYSTLLMLCLGVLTAVAPLAAHAIGAGDRPAAGTVASAGLIVATALVVPLIAILTMSPWLLAALGYDPALTAEIGQYLDIVRWGAPAFLGFVVLRFLLIALHRARVVMTISWLAVPVNAALNWALIFGHAGSPALGIEGAAMATAMLQWATLCCYAGYTMLAIDVPIRLARHAVAQIGRILRLGLPIGALLGLEIGVFVATGVLMGLLGADALGAHQLVFNVCGVCFMVPLGLSQAATVRVAFQLGAGSPAAAQRAGVVALSFAALFMATMAVLLWTAPRAITGLYLDLDDAANAGLIAVALQIFAIAALIQVPDGVQVVAAGALRGYRDTAYPMIIAAVGYWAIGFVGGWLLAFPLGLGALGLWSGLALGLVIVATALTLRLHIRSRSELRTADGLLLAAAGGAPS